MHICFITHEYPINGREPGGIGIFVKTMGAALSNAGHQVSVIGGHSAEGPKRYNDGKVSIYDLKTPRFPLFRWWQYKTSLLKAIKQLNKENKIDILEGQESAFAFIPRMKGVKNIVRLHGGHCFFASCAKKKINRLKKLKEQLSITKCDAIIGVSNYVTKQSANHLNIENIKTDIISSPVDTQHFTPQDNAQTIPHQLVFAGTLCRKKGLEELCQAIKILKSEFSDLKLIVVGKDSTIDGVGSYRDYLKKMFFPELENHVEFTGPLSQNKLKIYYSQAELCTFPSHMETQGLVAPEAMAMKKLVLFTKKGPGPETIEHKKNGLLCDPHDPNDIALQIRWALNNPKQASKIAECGYEFAIKKFSPAIALDRNITFFKSLL